MLQRIARELLSGVAVAIVALPLAIAFGITATGTSQGALIGLYGAIFAGFFAAVFGGTPGQVTGPPAPSPSSLPQPSPNTDSRVPSSRLSSPASFRSCSGRAGSVHSSATCPTP